MKIVQAIIQDSISKIVEENEREINNSEENSTNEIQTYGNWGGNQSCEEAEPQIDENMIENQPQVRFPTFFIYSRWLLI